MGSGCVRHRVLFRASWKHIFFIPGLENVSPGGGSDCQKGVQETRCAVKAEWKYLFIWFYDFLFFILFFEFFIFYFCFYSSYYVFKIAK